MRRALADRLLELGSVSRLAAELGVSSDRTRRLLRNGPPRRWTEQRLLEFAQALYRRAHDIERGRDSVTRDRLRRLRQRPVYTPAAQAAAAESLRRALALLEPRRVCEKGSWTPRAELARDLGVSSTRLGRWLERGQVPEGYMDRFATWAEIAHERAERQMAERGSLEQLIEIAKKPAYEHTLPGAPKQLAPRAPEVKSLEALVDSEEQSGYRWVLRVERWCTFELIEQLCAWALGRQRPKGMSTRVQAWIVTALVTIYHPHGRRPGKRKSPGGIRQFERRADRQQRGKDLSLNVPVSSATVLRGGLARAVRLFRQALTIEMCEHDQIYVHGIIVRSWRWRSKREQQNYRGRVTARISNEQALRERERQKRRAATRARAKARALERRGSAAGPARAPAGARSRRKKRP